MIPNDYKFAIIYIIIGFIAAIGHWAKKRYIDRTTNCNLMCYITMEPSSTWKAASTLIAAEIGLSLSHTNGGLSVSELVACLGVGYAADSAANKAPDSAKNKEGA